MTWMLASVTSPREAEMAILAGADLIDLKRPSAGALGALPLQEIAAIVTAIHGRRPVSATIGDLPPDPVATAAAIETLIPLELAYVKVGFFTQAHIDACLPVLADLSARQRIVGVLFADRPTRAADPARFAAAGCAGLMIDTADKTAGGLRSQMGRSDLADFVTRSKRLGLLTGLAGSLGLSDIPQLLRLGPDYLGFRGALCSDGRRSGELDPQRLRAVRQTLLAPSSSGDWRPVPGHYRQGQESR